MALSQERSGQSRRGNRKREVLSGFANHFLLPCIDSALFMRAQEGGLVEQSAGLPDYAADEQWVRHQPESLSHLK
jgi:hypothetical protein